MDPGYCVNGRLPSGGVSAFTIGIGGSRQEEATPALWIAVIPRRDRIRLVE